jgi:2-polyprenyl-3-methyl-5-hydroxy-6-metoxy-1,4-benzoquinol methylase
MSMVRYLKLIEWYKPEKGKRIIDCACGPGEGMKAIQDNLAPIRLVGVDIDEQALKSARKITNNKAEYVIKNIRSLSCFEQFDYFFCVETLEHTYDFYLTSIVSSIVKSIAIGGTLFITVPGNEKICMESIKHKQFLPPSKLIDIFIDYFDSFNGQAFIKNPARPQAYTTIMEFKCKKKS